MNDITRAPLPDCHVQCVQYEFCPQMVCHRPADDPAAPGIEHDGQIQKSRTCRYKRKILSANSGGLSQGGKLGYTRLGTRSFSQPMRHPRGVQGGCDAHLLQSGFSETDVTASAHAECTHAL